MTIDYAAYNQTIKDYTTHALVKWLHEDTPRKDRHYHNAPRDIYPVSQAYGEGIVVASTLAILLCILTFLFFFLRGCFRLCRYCCCKKEPSPQNEKVNKGGKIVFLIAFVFVLGGVIYGFIANQQVTKGVGKIIGVIDDMRDLKDDQVESAREILYNIQNISSTAITLLDELKALNDTIDLPTDVFDNVDKITSEMSKSTDKIQEGIDKYDNIDITKYNGNIHKYDHYRWIVQLVILLVLLLPFLVVILGFFLKNKILQWNVLWIGVLSACLGWLLTGIETSAVLLMSDMCYDPSGLLMTAANDTSTELFPYVQFFVVCRGVVNPLEGNLDSATSAVDASQSAVNGLSDFVLSLKTQYNITISEFEVVNSTMNTITFSTNQVVKDVHFLLDSIFKCNRIHNNYVDSLDGVCHNTLEGYFALIVIQGGIAFLTLAAIFLSIRLYHQLAQEAAEGGSGGGGGGGKTAYAQPAVEMA